MIQVNNRTNIDDIKKDDFIELMNNNSDEDIYYDFKADIKPLDDKAAYKVRQAAVSFANTYGGFIFFGILDKKNKENKKGEDRIVGISETKDELGPYFTKKYLGKELCVPMIHFEGPKILKIKTKKIAIFKFLSSELKPHAIRKQIDNPLEFWARGAGTARPINYQGLIADLESSREQRGWLNAIFIDLDSLAIQYKDYEKEVDTPSIPDLIWSILLSNYGDLLRIIVQDTELLKKIYTIKEGVEKLNSVIDHVRRRGVIPINNNSAVIQGHKKDIESNFKKLIKLCEKTQKYLTENYLSIRELINKFN